MLEKRGFTYVTILIVFFLLAGSTWNVFFIVKNLNSQEKIIDKNIEIFNNCQLLSKESYFQSQIYRSVTKDSIIYTIFREEEETLVKIIVSAYEDGRLKEKIYRYHYLSQEVANETT